MSGRRVSPGEDSLAGRSHWPRYPTWRPPLARSRGHQKATFTGRTWADRTGH